MDTRLPENWLGKPELDDLTDKAFRIFIQSLMYAVKNQTDGELPEKRKRYWHPDSVTDSDIASLVEAGLWESILTGWQIVDYSRWQTTKAEFDGLETVRRNNRIRQQRKRAKDSDISLSRDSHTQKSRDTIGQDRLGKDRLGKAQNLELLVTETDTCEEPKCLNNVVLLSSGRPGALCSLHAYGTA